MPPGHKYLLVFPIHQSFLLCLFDFLSLNFSLFVLGPQKALIGCAVPLRPVNRGPRTFALWTPSYIFRVPIFEQPYRAPLPS